MIIYENFRKKYRSLIQNLLLFKSPLKIRYLSNDRNIWKSNETIDQRRKWIKTKKKDPLICLFSKLKNHILR